MMARSPLVSIIINNYNYHRFVRQAIESAIAQTYDNVEVIIVDDGSTDQSRSIIGEYATRARVILKENGGQASAFNAGIIQASGDFILLLDSDDYLYPEAVEVCVNGFPEGYSRVYYRLQIVNEIGKQVPEREHAQFFQSLDGDVFSILAGGASYRAAPTSGNLFHAQKLKAVLPIPEQQYRICADSYILVQTALSGPVRSIDRHLGAYRIHRDNNFFSQYRLISDRKRLKAQTEYFYISNALLAEACRKAGFNYRQEPFERGFFGLSSLCAAYVLRIDSPYIPVLRVSTLLPLIGRYLRGGESHLIKRIPQSICLFSVVVLPRVLSRPLLWLMDIWVHRLSWGEGAAALVSLSVRSVVQKTLTKL
jgi:glycosyltransferase involved in cell wall biosynthesis